MRASRARTYKEAAEDLVLPGQVGNALQGRERVHDIEQGEEAWALHDHPADAAGQVESALNRGLAHAIPRYQPLQRSSLCVGVSNCSVGGGNEGMQARELLTTGNHFQIERIRL